MIVFATNDGYSQYTHAFHISRNPFAQTAACGRRRDQYGGRHESRGEQELKCQRGRDADPFGGVEEKLGGKVRSEVEAVRGEAEPGCEEALSLQLRHLPQARGETIFVESVEI